MGCRGLVLSNIGPAVARELVGCRLGVWLEVVDLLRKMTEMYEIHLFMKLYKEMNTKTKFHRSHYSQIHQPTHFPYNYSEAVNICTKSP